MLFKRRQVICTNCGFLSWCFSLPDGEGPTRVIECPPYWRKRIQDSKDLGSLVSPTTGEDITIHCIRRQWFFNPSIKSTDDNYIDVNCLTVYHKCLYYIKYDPGFGPEEHKELKSQDDTRKTVFKAALIGAIIGASAAIFTQILYLLLSKSP